MAKPCRSSPRRRRHERNARSGKEAASNKWREVLCAGDLTGDCAAWRSHAAVHPLVAARQTARTSALRRTRVKYACRSSSRKSLTEVNLFREYCGTFYGGTSAAHGTGLVQFASVRSVSCSVRKPLIWTMSHAPWRRNPFASKCSLLMSDALAHASTFKSRQNTHNAKTAHRQMTMGCFWLR